MIVSTKGKYALQLMLELSDSYKGDPVKIKDVSKHQDISEKYLEQIVSYLGKARLVKSVRGAKGGYVLVHSPEDYKVYDILKAVENNLQAVDYEGDEVSFGDNKEVKACSVLWKELDDAVYTILNKVTLADLVKVGSGFTGGVDEGCWI